MEPDNVRAMSDLVALAKKEGNWAEVKRLQTRQLELNPDDELAMQDIIEASKRLGDLKSPQQSIESLKKHLEEIKPENIEVVEEEFSIESQVRDDKASEITEVRRRLYAGEIEYSEIKQIAETYEGSVKGVILIAEVCTYFGKTELAEKALKGYKKKHEDMSKPDSKRINQAMQIVKSKKKINASLKWASTYGEETRSFNTACSYKLEFTEVGCQRSDEHGDVPFVHCKIEKGCNFKLIINKNFL